MDKQEAELLQEMEALVLEYQQLLQEALDELDKVKQSDESPKGQQS